MLCRWEATSRPEIESIPYVDEHGFGYDGNVEPLRLRARNPARDQYLQTTYIFLRALC